MIAGAGLEAVQDMALADGAQGVAAQQFGQGGQLPLVEAVQAGLRRRLAA